MEASDIIPMLVRGENKVANELLVSLEEELSWSNLSDIILIAGRCYDEIPNKELNSLVITCLRRSSAEMFLDLIEILLSDNFHVSFHHLLVDEAILRLDEIKNNRCQWERLIFDCPYKLQKSCIEELKVDGSRRILRRICEIIRLFDSDSELRVYKFLPLFDEIFNRFDVDSIEMSEFLPRVISRIPFHPFIVCHDSGIFLPQVYDLSYRDQEIASNLSDFVVGKDRAKVANVVEKTLNFLDGNLPAEFPGWILTAERLIYSLLPFVQDFDIGESRVNILRKCEFILNNAPSTIRVLIVKRLFERIARVNCIMEGQPFILAWLIDQYKLYLDESIYQEELGTFWSLVQPVRMEDVAMAAAFYVSVFNLAQAQALRRLDGPMMRNVKVLILDPIRDQIRDYLQLTSMQQKPNNGLSEIVTANTMDLIIFNLDYADNVIARFLQTQ